eukprot:CAMPEP_0203846582 /NCGR_PEP_ID=MMETSP0359-20131031/4514_1 /ASSEMBLY_ACC=CAM_ASM_000338 /TAXON_ID=268821 /ORGANISM="Scrippsiella Hangoei, Strain SHTV-5" /LENGTH=90 /DNA_ID=CAMNT_0050761931 /DNA_START=512 /DNA_END=780 /DNA_ORIENTATION=+
MGGAAASTPRWPPLLSAAPASPAAAPAPAPAAAAASAPALPVSVPISVPIPAPAHAAAAKGQLCPHLPAPHWPAVAAETATDRGKGGALG